jgi:transcriptional regulator with XRE-family HTH domain
VAPSFYPDEYRAMLRRLREARKAAGFTQVAAAEALGKPQSFISKAESGERRLDPVELARFAALYGVEVGALVGEAG